VDYDPGKVVGDAELAQQVQVGGAGGAPQVTGYIVWIRMMQASFNASDPSPAICNSSTSPRRAR